MIALDAGYQGGRIIVGAVAILFCISRGITVSQYAAIKSVQLLVFLICDLPLGILISWIGPKPSLYISLAFAIGGVGGFLAAESFFQFIVAEMCMAISLSIWPVAFNVFAIERLDLCANSGLEIDRFMHHVAATTNLVMIVLGLAGGLLFRISPEGPYLLMGVTFFIVIAILATFRSAGAPATRQQPIGLLAQLKMITPLGLWILLGATGLLTANQYLLQPLANHWSPFFREAIPSITSDRLSIIFVGYSLTRVLFSWGYAQLTRFALARSRWIFSLILALISLCYLAITSYSGTLIALLAFMALQGLTVVANTSGYALIYRTVPPEQRAMTGKSVMLISRLGMAMGTGIIYLLASGRPDYTTQGMFQIFARCSIGLTLASFTICLLGMRLFNTLQRISASDK